MRQAGSTHDQQPAPARGGEMALPWCPRPGCGRPWPRGGGGLPPNLCTDRSAWGPARPPTPNLIVNCFGGCVLRMGVHLSDSSSPVTAR